MQSWLEHWVENIAKPYVSENTYDGCEVDVRVHIVPGLGAHKIDRVEPEHLERFYRMKQQSGRVALGEAVRRGHVATNVAEIAKAPRLEGEDIEPFTIERFRACSWGRPSWATGPAGWSPWRSAFGTEKRLVAGGPATARTASRSGVSTRAPSLVPDGARSGCLIRSSSFCASTRRSRSRRERAVAVALGGQGVRLRVSARWAAEPQHRLPRVEAAASRCGRTRRPTS